MLVPYDTCQCCLGHSARLRRTGEVFCDDCWNIYPEDDGEGEYLDAPPWADIDPTTPTTN